MAPSLRRGVKFFRQAANKHASSKTTKAILNAKSSTRCVARNKIMKVMTASKLKRAAQLAVSLQHPSRKESRITGGGEASPTTSSNAGSACSSKSNRIDKVTCSSKDKAQHRPSRCDQGSTASTKQVGTTSLSTKILQRLSPQQATRLKASLPQRFKVERFESGESDDVDDPDCTRAVNNVESGPSQKVMLADSATIGKATPRQCGRSGYTEKVDLRCTERTAIRRHGSIVAQLNKDSKKLKLQDTSEGHQKKDTFKEVPTGKGQQKVNVPSTNSSVTGTADLSRRLIAAARSKLGNFREPVVKEPGSSYKCCVEGCLSNDKGIACPWLFLLPCEEEEPSLRSTWLEGVPIDIEANRPLSPCVCFKHFDTAKDFVTIQHRIRGLNVNAVPSIRIPVLKVVKDPFVTRRLQMQSVTRRLNTGSGLTANSAAGSNTPKQEAQATMATSSASKSAVRRCSMSVDKSTRVMDRTVTEMAGKIHGPARPIGAVGPNSSSVTETANSVITDHTEAGARTVTVTAGETLHGAPGDKSTVSPSESFRTEIPDRAAVETSRVKAAEVAVETSRRSVHAVPGTKGTGSPSAISMTENPKQATLKSAEISVQTAMETTGESLHAAPQVVSASSLSSNLTMETLKETAVESIEDSVHTPTGMTKQGLSSAPQPKETTSASPHSTAETLTEPKSVPAEVNASTVTRKTVGTLNIARKPNATNIAKSVSLMVDPAKEPPSKPIEFSAHILPPATVQSSDIAEQPIGAVGYSPAAESHKSSDASRFTPDAHTVAQPTTDSDVVPWAQYTAGKRDIGSEQGMEDNPSSLIECTFSTSCKSGSAESKTLQPSSSGAKQPPSDRKFCVLDCSIVQLSPTFTVALSSDKDDSRAGGNPNLIDDTVEMQASVTVEPQRYDSGMSSGTSSGTFGHSASMREGCDSTATVVQKEKTRCPPCDGHDALSHAVAQKNGTGPSGPTSSHRQGLQKAGRAAATDYTSVQEHSSGTSVSADLDETGRSRREGGGEARLYCQSRGRYIIEREVVGDENEFGMHAISFRVDWVPTGGHENMSCGRRSQQ